MYILTEITVMANKRISLSKSEISYCGEAKSDIFKILVPCHINGILSKESVISFCFVTPNNTCERILLNEIGGVTTRLGSYLMFYFRPNKTFYSHIGNVKCWIEFQYNDILIKSDICEIKIHKHFCNNMQEKIIKWI